MGCGAVGGLVAAGVGAAGAIGGSLISASAAKSAANTQASAANQAAALQEQEQQQVRSDLNTYNVGGSQATNVLTHLLFGDDPNYQLAQLKQTPGYNFALTQGLESTQNSAAARGLGTSGAALKGAANYAEGLAENTYQSNLLNPLISLMQTGESAAAQTGSLGTQGAANAGAGLVGAGNAAAAGTVGAANAASGGLSALSNTPLNYLLYSKLLSPGSSNNGSSFYGSGTGAGGSPTYGALDS